MISSDQKSCFPPSGFVGFIARANPLQLPPGESRHRSYSGAGAMVRESLRESGSRVEVQRVQCFSGSSELPLQANSQGRTLS